MDKIGSTFIWNEETEIERLIHTAKQVWSGFYISKGFLVVPELSEGDAASVCLPDLEYGQISNWKESLQKVKLNFPIKVDREFQNKSKGLLKNKMEIDNSWLQIISKEWRKIETEFWEVVADFMPGAVNLIANVEIRLTFMGTISSYQYLTEKPKQNFIIYIRKDGKTSNIAEAILTGLIYTQVEASGWTWEEVEAMVDFILTRSKLKNILPNFSETLKGLRNRDLEKEKISKVFLEKLGIEREKKLRMRYGEIYLYGEKIGEKLSRSQQRILKGMLKSENGFISLIEIERILWGDEDGRGGVWAINKSVQRLRKQLIDLGTDRFIIKTVRGRGYCLNNI